MIPTNTISTGDMCVAIREVMNELKKRNMLEFSNAAIYTYVLTYQMSLNAIEESIFEKCVDSRMLEEPLDYCKRGIVRYFNSTLWSEQAQQRSCEEGAAAMFKKCGKSVPENSKQILVTGAELTASMNITSNPDVCYPCAYVISFLFAKYEKFTTMTVEGVFESLIKKSAEVLKDIKMQVNNETPANKEARLKAQASL